MELYEQLVDSIAEVQILHRLVTHTRRVSALVPLPEMSMTVLPIRTRNQPSAPARVDRICRKVLSKLYPSTKTAINTHSCRVRRKRQPLT
jgi:hypothetical protein